MGHNINQLLICRTGEETDSLSISISTPITSSSLELDRGNNMLSARLEEAAEQASQSGLGAGELASDA